MIISQTPFRISFAGGGSDIAEYYRKDGGAVLSTTINKYMYIALHPYFNSDKIFLKYSKTELCDSVAQIAHPILRAVLQMYSLNGIDINSIADIPGGTGLGSSSAFTVGLLHAINAYMNKFVSASFLADTACRIEIDMIKSPIGKQDQYAVAFGGLNFIVFNPDDTVDVQKVIISPQKKRLLEESLIMLYTGETRSANEILKNQKSEYVYNDKLEIQKRIVKLAYYLKETIENDNIDDFGRILHESWLLKKSITTGISNSLVDVIYEKGIAAGADGGKLLGAGGGGFLLFYCAKEKQENFRQKMSDFKEVAFRFDNAGSKIIYIGES